MLDDTPPGRPPTAVTGGRSPAGSLEHVSELEAIYQTAPFGLALVDREMRVIKHNLKLGSALLKDLLDQIEPLIQRVFHAGEPVLNCEVCAQASGTAKRWLQVSASPLKTPDGATTAASCVVQDITERKRAERREAEACRRQEFLRECATALLKTDDPLKLLDAVYQRLASLLNVDVYFHYAAEGPDKPMRLVAWQGIPAEVARNIERLEFGQAVCGTVAADRSPISVSDVQGCRDEKTELIRGLGITAYVCHPLLARGRLLGTLSFGSREHTEFNDNDVALIRSVCEQVATAVDRKRDRDQLQKLNEMLETQVMERTARLSEQAARLRSLTRQLSEAEERERTRLAHILHEHLQQLVVAAKMRVGTVRSQVDDEGLTGELAAVEDLLSQVVQEARSLTVELRPPLLREERFDTAVRWLARRFEQTHRLRVQVQVERPVPRLDEEVATMLFDALRELLFNVVKHSRSDAARVRIDNNAGFAILVEDDGEGFDPKILERRRTPRSGFGLLTIRDRARALGGDLQVDSAPGRGARFRLVSPTQTVARMDPTPTVGRVRNRSVP